MAEWVCIHIWGIRCQSRENRDVPRGLYLGSLQVSLLLQQDRRRRVITQEETITFLYVFHVINKPHHSLHFSKELFLFEESLQTKMC